MYTELLKIITENTNSTHNEAVKQAQNITHDAGKGVTGFVVPTGRGFDLEIEVEGDVVQWELVSLQDVR